MNKLFLISLLLVCIIAHKHLDGHKKLNKQNKGISFHSATFEMQNMGDKDYKLDPKIASNWDEETKNLNKEVHANKKQMKHQKMASKKLHPNHKKMNKGEHAKH